MKIQNWTEPVTLEGRLLDLEPATMKHLDSLATNILNPKAWQFTHWNLRTKDDVEKMLAKSLQAREEKTANAFVMVEKSERRAVGISNFMNLNYRHNFLEIGGTCIGENWQKTHVNTEAKFLMLRYIFENLNCQRVEFRVDSLNTNSQRAVQRIGAKYEGELRNSWLRFDGLKRDYKLYSIIDTDWPNIKNVLNWHMDKYVSS